MNVRVMEPTDFDLTDLTIAIHAGIARRGSYVLMDERVRLLHGAKKGADLSLHRDAILEFAEERGWHAEIQSNSITFWDTTARAEQ
jgi:hypothetical protein